MFKYLKLSAYRIPIVVLAVGSMLSLLVGLYLENESRKDELIEFSFASDEITQKIRETLGTFAITLRGGVGLFAASESITRENWKQYSDVLALPGVQGFGYAQKIAPELLAQHEKDVQAQGFPEYKVYPLGEREIYTSIIYLEPFSDRNLNAFGYDMFSDITRRKAMEQARDTGDAALTGKVELVQEGKGKVQAGLLMYVPVYAKGNVVNSIEKRRQALQGWVYSPYRMDDLMAGALSQWINKQGFNVDIKMFDNADYSDSSLLFSLKGVGNLPLNTFEKRVIDFNGNSIHLFFGKNSSSTFITSFTFWLPFIVGLVCSFLLFGLLLSLSNTHNKVIKMAQILSFELLEKEATLQEKDLRWKLAVDEVGDGLWELHVKTHDFEISKLYAEMLGYQEGELPSHIAAWEEMVHPDDRDDAKLSLEKYVNGETSIYSNEFRLLCKNGEYKWILCRGTGVEQDENGKIVRLIGINSDISERKLKEFEALQMKAQLVQATKMESMGHLTAGIAHDFNNLLGAMVGNISLARKLLTSSTKDAVDKCLQEALLASDRATSLIKQMLTFSRMPSEGDSQEAQLVQVAPVVREAVSLLRSVIPMTVELECTIDPACEDLKVTMDAVNLHQIVLNLGVNARDAVGEYGSIAVNVCTVHEQRAICSSCSNEFSGEWLKMVFSDNGSGIDSSAISKIFDPFYTNKAVGKGTGMGLSVVHGLVHSSNGHICVKTMDKKGTEFALYFPLVHSDDDVTSTITEQTKEEPISLAGIRIMVIDDEVALASMLQNYLEAFSASVTMFNDPSSALAVFKQNHSNFDVIITDETMPNMSGMLLATNMLVIDPTASIIMCTGYSEYVTVDSATKLGIMAFFYKPVNMTTLINKIHALGKKDNQP
ncbi:CHASE domain-containing protein [Paraglaciecola sp. 25GB23A]|uniref:CHASE domain-containing protein n=1 Tax=Paraglaciecola sp. 25GB23A TaxID=3156068 RepID=UPI0032AE8766